MNSVFHAHSGLRWLVLLGVVLIVLKSLVGVFRGSSYTKFDKILGSATVGLLDLQLLLGFLLYFFHSPFITFNMGNTTERFWSVEHLLLMIVAVVFVHVGKMKANKALMDSTKFKFQLLFFGLSIVMMSMGIPWSRLGG